MGQKLAHVVFQPPPPSYQKDPSLIWLKSCEDDIPAFYISREGAKYTLLFSHGNAEDLGLIIRNFCEVSHILHVNVFLYEYAGYGQSSGQAKEHTVYSNIEAAFKYVRDEIGTPWEHIVPYGRSIGTAPTMHLAALTAVRGIILLSPMMSIYRIPFHFRFTLPGDGFSNIDKVPDVCCPVFVIHGTRDEIVPVWHGQGLYEACLERGTAYSAYVVGGADHNSLEQQAGDAFYDRMQRFLKHLEDTPVSEQLQRQAENSRI